MAERMFTSALASAASSANSLVNTFKGGSPELSAQYQAASSMNGAVESKAAQRLNFDQFLNQSRIKQSTQSEGSRRPNTLDVSGYTKAGDINYGYKE